MTIGQASGPNMSWLDEELRREKSIVEALRDTVDKQQVTLVDQSQRIISLEDRLTKLQNQLQTIPELRNSVQSTRDELAAMMGDLRQDVQKQQSEALRARQAEREKDQRTVQEIRAELGRIAPLEQSATISRAEDRRLSESLMRLQQELETLGKRIAQGEDGRTQLADSISKNTVEIKQAIEEIAELGNVRPELTKRILPLEDGLSKLVQQVRDLQNMRQEITSQQQELVERERRSERARAQTMTEWGRRLDGFTQQMEAWADQLRFFADQHEKNRRVLRDVQMLAQDISQQQDRLQQLQRITEEQLRRELREARTENDQRWAQEMERREQSRLEEGQHEDEQDERLVQLEEMAEDLAQALDSANTNLQSIRDAMQAQADEAKIAHRKALKAAGKEFGELISALAEMYDVRE